MKTPGICSDGSSCRHTFTPFVRVKKPSSHVKHLYWFQTLLLAVLLAGQASCNETSAAPPLVPTTKAQTSVYYSVVVSVDVNGQKNESEIVAWLKQVFKNRLHSCVSPNHEETTATPTSPQTTSANTSYVTTLQSYNKTTAMETTTLQSNSTTTAAATTTLQGNDTTTAAETTTLQGNNTTTASTLQSNNTTTAAATTMLQGNNTTNNTTTAAATTTLQGNNTTTAAATTTLQGNDTTTAAETTTLQGKNTTTAAETTTLQGKNTTTAAETTTLQGKNTTTAAETTTLQGNNTTTAAETTTLQGNNTTTAAETTTLQGNNTTTAAETTTLQGNNTTTAAATTMLQGNNTMTAATATTTDDNHSNNQSCNHSCNYSCNHSIKNNYHNHSCNHSCNNSINKHHHIYTCSNCDKKNYHSYNNSVKKNYHNHSCNNSINKHHHNYTCSNCDKKNYHNHSCNNSVKKHLHATSNDKTTDIFQDMDVSCVKKTAIRNTNCSVTLKLKQSVHSCCILRTLCLASNSSSDIHVVGKTADRISRLPNECNNDTQELNSCTYIGPDSASCGTAYVVPQGNSTHCGTDKKNNTCSCSAYCSGTDAYYTFNISIQDSMMNFSYVLSLISKLKQPNCSLSSDVSCPLSAVASEYKDANVECESTSTNLQSCKVILGFGHEVPICNVSAALRFLFQSEKEIRYNGRVTQAAICGNSLAVNPLKSTLMWINLSLKPATFCTDIEEFNTQTCQRNVLVELDEWCVQEAFTTPGPNVTTAQPNATTSSVNVTSSPLNTTADVTESGLLPPRHCVQLCCNICIITSLKCTIVPTVLTAAESQANALFDMTADVSKMNSSQVAQLVSELLRLLSGPTVSMALGNTSVHIVSNLLGASPEVLSDSSNSIIEVVDTVGLKLVIHGNAENLLSPAVALSVKPADGRNFQETFFSISDPNNVQVRGDSRPSRSVRSDSSIPQGSIRLPPTLTEDLTIEQQQLASRVQFNFYQESTVYQDKSLGDRKLNSGILGASVANLTIKELQDDVVIHLRNTEPVPANFVATCVFWDFTLNNESGGWNPKGCFVRNSTDNETVCACNHLTSFAILLDLSREPLINRVQATILTFITYIGCGVSAIFLSITILTYLSFGKLRKDIPSKILVQLCVALLLLNLVFLVDAWLALYPDAVGLCISTAWFLHYFLLVTFTWMGLEAVHMYLALVKVFNSYISRSMVKYSLVGWGVPMIVVIIVIAIDKDNYGLVSYGKFSDGTSDEFCWLKNDIAFYVSVVAYFCIIFVFNIAMFVVVLVQLCRIKRQNPHNLQHRSTLQDIRSVAGITILLGLTWGFAFFAWGPLNLPFMYLFAIFNSLQGFFIFVFYCAVKENVRKQWRTFLCCGKMRLAENSEWSRTATQKIAKKSSETRVTSLHSSQSSQSNNSSSSTSFLVSDSSELNNGVGSPFEDRTITADEDPSMDVVLNEINMQYRNQQTP
ncbi:uncharacterized protein LOC115018749 [Cottoperca gobio]|uniref:Adhesion G-protein coupled receptor G2 n=1 Tax=Cottoperca gobio TaxID=56716 RepID=A0A6J2R2Y7_COTGO|nr:uncharacterized protein LOC115018749 [Cottoperca gobio]